MSKWTVVVPVKGGPAAKSRLRPPQGVARADLARAFALDTLEAVTATPGARAVLVSDDVWVRAFVAGRGGLLVSDPGGGLGAAVEAGLAAAACVAAPRPGPRGDPPAAGPARDPCRCDPARGTGADATGATGTRGGIAILLGDLPALRSGDLLEGLAACARHDTAFVPDDAGTGTVLLTAHDAGRLRPRFGVGSARAHARGAARLDLALPRLRRDVDVAGDLRAALTLGVGRHTRRVLAACCRALEPPTDDRTGGHTTAGPDHRSDPAAS